VASLTVYVAATFFYVVALRRVPLSVALPCTAASYIAAVFVGDFTMKRFRRPTSRQSLLFSFWCRYVGPAAR
jgi:hypothetical protein